MKSMKKLATCLFAILLFASMAFAPAAFAAIDLDSATVDVDEETGAVDLTDAKDDADDDASSDESDDGLSSMYVLDQGGLIDSSVEHSYTQKAEKLAKQTGIAAYYITTSGLNGATPTAMADKYYNTLGLGAGKNHSALVLVISAKESALAIVPYGDAKSKFPTNVITAYTNDIKPYVNRTDWAGSLETYYGDVEKTLTGKNSTTDAAANIKYAEGTYVIDGYGLFDESQRSELETMAQALAAQYSMGVYLLVVDNMGSSSPTSAQRTNFATSFYKAHNLGLGSGKDGIMFVIARGSRDYVTIAYGQGSYSFSDAGIEAMEKAVTDKLHDDDWFGGAEAYYNKIGEQLEYYSVKGEPWTEPNFLSLLLKIAAIIGIPAVVVGGVITGEKNAMTTAKERREASNYLDRSSYELIASNDEFVNTTLSVVPKPKSESSSGGGGGWGGGGGGGFSSSGGGKF